VQAEASSELLPDGSVAVVPDTAYLRQLEGPTETARLIRQFWAIHAAPNPTQLIATNLTNWRGTHQTAEQAITQ
jgi:hypothetical protein